MLTKQYPIAMTIAGSDSSGGAGIQADIKAISSLGVYAASVITAVTAQNTKGVTAIQAIRPDIIESQGLAVLSDLSVNAIKLGMLHDEATILVVAKILRLHPTIPVVADPVMVATSGDRLLKEGCIEAYKSQIFPHITLLTPNLQEASLLAGGISVDTIDQMLEAGKSILTQGCVAVLIKGGHLANGDRTDILMQQGQEPIFLKGKDITTHNTHGTGCTLSAAIAAFLSLGHTISEACVSAKEYLQSALEAGADVQIGKGHGPVNHFFNPTSLIAK